MAAKSASPLARIIGANIREAREAAGMTQHELAIALGRGDGPRISGWERGNARPSDATICKFAEILGREVAWFFTDNEADSKVAA